MTHICNNCDYKYNCNKSFNETVIMCLNNNEHIKQKQQKRFDKEELKELAEFLKQ